MAQHHAAHGFVHAAQRDAQQPVLRFRGAAKGDRAFTAGADFTARMPEAHGPISTPLRVLIFVLHRAFGELDHSGRGMLRAQISQHVLKAVPRGQLAVGALPPIARYALPLFRTQPFHTAYAASEGREIQAPTAFIKQLPQRVDRPKWRDYLKSAPVNTAIRKPTRPLLERLGGRFLQAGKVAPASADDPIHVLNPVERAGLLRVTRGAVLRAALAGVLNAAFTGFGALFAAHVLGHKPEHATLAQSISYWGLFGALALVAAVLEIAYLYWTGGW